MHLGKEINRKIGARSEYIQKKIYSRRIVKEKEKK